MMNTIPVTYNLCGIGAVQNPQELPVKVKLEFNTDFTRFLELDGYNDPICIVTESEIIKCNALLLAQHSSVLRDHLKEDKELFLTDNKHVRECLSILYGGSVELTEENFQDILKFMVCFDITSVRDQVLDWMSQRKWNLDDISLLINGSMIAVKNSSGSTSDKSLREKIYGPCRLFFKKGLVEIIDSSHADERYRSLDKAFKSIFAGLTDRKEFLAMLLHQDLLPTFIPWINVLIDQSSYSVFLVSLQRSEIVNKMSMCSRAQIDGLFDKIEDFESMTLKEYKHLNKLKLQIKERMGDFQSLKFIKENGNRFSCWRLMDFNGLSVIPTLFTSTSDQFCIVENFLTWLSKNKCTNETDKQRVVQLIRNALKNISENMNNGSFQIYNTYTADILKSIQRLPSSLFSALTLSANGGMLASTHCRLDSPLAFQLYNWVIGGRMHSNPKTGFREVVPEDQILIFAGVYVTEDMTNRSLTSSSFTTPSCFTSSGLVSTSTSGFTSSKSYDLQLTVRLFQDKVPEISVSYRNTAHLAGCSYIDPNSLFSYNIFACKHRINRGAAQGFEETTHIPLYTDPTEAFKILQQYQMKWCNSGNVLIPEYLQQSYNVTTFGMPDKYLQQSSNVTTFGMPDKYLQQSSNVTTFGMPDNYVKFGVLCVHGA